MQWTEYFALGVAVGSAVAYAILRLVSGLRGRGEAAHSGTSVPDWITESPAEVAEAVPVRRVPQPIIPAGAFGRPVTSTPPSEAGRSTPGSPAAADGVRISRRLVLHLAQVGQPGWDELGSPAATQRGIGLALTAEQSAVSKVLRRLVAADVVSATRRHVRGQDRRVNVYALTRRGRLLAIELRNRDRGTMGTPGHSAPPHPTGFVDPSPRGVGAPPDPLRGRDRLRPTPRAPPGPRAAADADAGR